MARGIYDRWEPVFLERDTGRRPGPEWGRRASGQGRIRPLPYHSLPRSLPFCFLSVFFRHMDWSGIPIEHLRIKSPHGLSFRTGTIGERFLGGKVLALAKVAPGCWKVEDHGHTMDPFYPHIIMRDLRSRVYQCQHCWAPEGKEKRKPRHYPTEPLSG